MTAWPGLKTWALLDAGLFGDLNTYVRDALDNLYNAPSVLLSRATAFPVASGAGGIDVAWTTEPSDPYGFHAANATQIIVPAGLDGLYVVFACWEMNAPAANSTSATLLINANGYAIADDLSPYPASFGPTLAAATIWPLAAGDVLTANVNHGSAASQNVNVGAAYSPHFGAVWVAP